MASNFEKLMEPMKDIDFQSMGQEEDNGEGDEAAASSVDIQVKKYDDPEKVTNLLYHKPKNFNRHYST